MIIARNMNLRELADRIGGDVDFFLAEATCEVLCRAGLIGKDSKDISENDWIENLDKAIDISNRRRFS